MRELPWRGGGLVSPGRICSRLGRRPEGATRTALSSGRGDPGVPNGGGPAPAEAPDARWQPDTAARPCERLPGAERLGGGPVINRICGSCWRKAGSHRCGTARVFYSWVGSVLGAASLAYVQQHTAAAGGKNPLFLCKEGARNTKPEPFRRVRMTGLAKAKPRERGAGRWRTTGLPAYPVVPAGWASTSPRRLRGSHASRPLPRSGHGGYPDLFRWLRPGSARTAAEAWC